MGCIHPKHHRTPKSLIDARKKHGPGVHACVHPTTIHERPDSKSPVVGQLKQWAHLIAIGEQNGWVQHELGWTYKYFGNDSPCLLTIEDIYVVVALGGVNAYDAPKVGATHITHLDFQEEVPCFGSRGEWIYHPFGWSVMKNNDGNANLKLVVDDNAGLNAGAQEGQADSFRVLAPARGLNVRAVPDVTAPVEDCLPVGTEVTKIETQGDWLHHSKGWSLIWGYENRRFILYLEQASADPQAHQKPTVKPIRCNCTKCQQPIQASVPINANDVHTELIIVCPFCESRFRMKITAGPREGQPGGLASGSGAGGVAEHKSVDDDQIEGQANIELHAMDGEKSPPATPRTPNTPGGATSFDEAGAISALSGAAAANGEGEGKRGNL